MKKALIIVFLLIFAFGCKKYTKPAEEAPAAPDETVTEEMAEPEEEVIEETVMPEEEAFEEGVVEETLLTPEEKAEKVLRDIYFDYDKYNIRPEARPVLNSVASLLDENPQLNIVIEGHCDERGTNEYNLALGEKRANSTKEYLVSLGVSPERIITITFGEEKPVCSMHNEICWQKNRRAHFAVVKE